MLIGYKSQSSSFGCLKPTCSKGMKIKETLRKYGVPDDVITEFYNFRARSGRQNIGHDSFVTKMLDTVEKGGKQLADEVIKNYASDSHHSRGTRILFRR